MNKVSELTIAELRNIGAEFPVYNQCLREAFDAAPPPHAKAWYGNLYRSLSKKPEWFARSLMINSHQEGFGSRRIWEFSRRIEDTTVAELVRGHSMDESRHSKMFAGLLDTIFPGSIQSDSLREEVRAFSPGYTKKNHPPTDYDPALGMTPEAVMRELISVNIVEIRALVLQLLLRPMMHAYCKVEDRERILRASETLISDEVKHIRYSAYCIERHAELGHGEYVRATMLDCQRACNEEFLAEVATENLG